MRAKGGFQKYNKIYSSDQNESCKEHNIFAFESRTNVWQFLNSDMTFPFLSIKYADDNLF